MCCGSSAGIAQGAGCGKYLARWMVEGDAEINMTNMDSRRFGDFADANYTRSKSFQDYEHMYITHLPGDELPAGRGRRQSAIHAQLLAKGAVHTEAFGWERPKWFSLDGRQEKSGFRRNNTHDIVAAECLAVRDAVIDGEQVRIDNVTADFGNLAIAGPKSRDVLAQLTKADLSSDSFRWLSAQEIEIAGVAVRALRVNYVGELGWELHHPMVDMPRLYDAICSAGAAHGIVDFGAYAMKSMRMEKAYRSIGTELTNEIGLIEADMERFLKFDKEHFIGRAASLSRKQSAATMQLVYCVVDADDADAHGGESVFDGDKVIGVTTSGGYGHRTQLSLVFAFVELAYARPGCCFEIKILDKKHRARVLTEPVYDPKDVRLRA
jgi:glycine cleavage system aminomethyltransferase T